MKNEQNDYVLWFDNLIAPKHIEASDGSVKCLIGFNRTIKSNDKSQVIGDTIEIEGTSIIEVLQDAKIQYDFLTSSDVLDTI